MPILSRRITSNFFRQLTSLQSNKCLNTRAADRQMFPRADGRPAFISAPAFSATCRPCWLWVARDSIGSLITAALRWCCLSILPLYRRPSLHNVAKSEFPLSLGRFCLALGLSDEHAATAVLDSVWPSDESSPGTNLYPTRNWLFIFNITSSSSTCTTCPPISCSTLVELPFVSLRFVPAPLTAISA